MTTPINWFGVLALIILWHYSPTISPNMLEQWCNNNIQSIRKLWGLISNELHEEFDAWPGQRVILHAATYLMH